MDEMRNRYRVPGRDDEQRPRPVHETLRHAYQPPPRRAPIQPLTPHPTRTHVPAPQPAVPRPEPIHHQPEPVGHHYSHRKPKRRLWRKFAVVIVILAALAAGGVYAYPKYVNANPFSPDIQANAGLALFYPAKLPAGYTIDKKSMNLTNGVVLYAANKGNLRLVFTQQKLPTDLDFTNFYKQQLPGAQQFDTPFGQAVIGKNGDRYLGSLTSGTTWLLLSNNNSSISLDDMSLVMIHLKKY